MRCKERKGRHDSLAFVTAELLVRIKLHRKLVERLSLGHPQLEITAI